MALIYDRNTFQSAIVDATKYPNIGSQLSILAILNRIVKLVLAEVDLRSTKRKAAAIKLFTNEYEYTAPSDLKDQAVIDIIPQLTRSLSRDYTLTSNEEFDRLKSRGGNLVTIFDADVARKLRFTGTVNDTPTTLAGLDATTSGGGTWIAFGNASTVVVDITNYVVGSGSLSFTLTSGGTTAGLVNSTLTSTNIAKYTSDGAVFVWAYIVATANITNFILRIGSSSTAYHAITVTTQSDGSAFRVGWNLLQFNFTSTSDTGTPDDTAMTYIATYMTKTSGKTGNLYRFDDIQIHTGEYAQVHYYSAYGWSSDNAGTFIENSTAATDYLVCLTDEFELYAAKGREIVYKELREYDQMKLAQAEYQTLKSAYLRRSPSERLKLSWFYH